MSVPGKVLVTGGAGFIGSYVVDTLIRQGSRVVIFDHNAPGTIDPALFKGGVELFQGDVRDDIAVTEAAAHVDGIIHLSAVLGTQETIQNPRPSAVTNIIGGLNVFEAANQYNLPVVYAGVGNYWMREHGAGSYTISKTVIEDYSRMFNKFRGSRISVVRPVNAYGPRQSVAAPYGSSKVRKIIPSFVCRALAGDDIEVYGNGTSISDCVFVGDVATVFVESLNRLHAGDDPTVVEVGPRISYSVREIADLVARTVAEYTGQPLVNVVHIPMRPGEVPNSVTSANFYSVREVGVNPHLYLDLGSGIKKTVEWYAENWLASWNK